MARILTACFATAVLAAMMGVALFSADAVIERQDLRDQENFASYRGIGAGGLR